MSEFLTEANAQGIKIETNVALAKYTTWNIGGPAQFFFSAESVPQLIKVVELAKAHAIPVTILGAGSNILISDAGISGLVIRNKCSNLEVLDQESEAEIININNVEARLVQKHPDEYYSFAELDYSESEAPKIEVSVEAGAYLPQLINNLIARGITGLQWYSGIPGSLGGAIYNNIHGGSHFISEVVKEVTVLDEDLNTKTLTNAELKFGYDYSRFHETQEIILSAVLVLLKGDKEKARNTSIAWAVKKKLQPRNSAGCCFQNIDSANQNELGLESNSWGYIIDKVLGLKGKTIGKAKISEKHAAFIETTPGAKASDVLALFDIIYDAANKKLGITPKPEIFFLGFSKSEIQKYK